ncbi:unnamed protein product [Nippostrongylus brasiliensis]|uniref:PALP domain-containing protein n=1 Tax=Nippostrongylus brasiliensis TaxID=27835 RepID=A0A0N4Y0X4_NIPBR|nr:unnamed protein product [Nippostrongylus brasiliensis]
MSLSADGSIEEALCQRMLWHASTISGAPGLVALVSDAGNYGPTLTALARGGWRIAIFHPPETSSTFLDYADESFALPIHREQIEERCTTVSIGEEASREQVHGFRLTDVCILVAASQRYSEYEAEQTLRINTGSVKEMGRIEDMGWSREMLEEPIQEHGVTNLPYALNFTSMSPSGPREDCTITAMAQDLRQNPKRNSNGLWKSILLKLNIDE